MALLTKELLQDIGVALSDEEYQLLAEHFDTTLEERVTMELAEVLTAEQAQQLAILEDASQVEYRQWLEQNIPDFADIVSDEVDILLGEIAESSAELSGDLS